jgi:hypothetical protein
MFYYYSCRNRRLTHKCAKVHEKKDFIEWYILLSENENTNTEKSVRISKDLCIEVTFDTTFIHCTQVYTIVHDLSKR